MTQEPTEQATARKQRLAAERGQWVSLDDLAALLFGVAVFSVFRSFSDTDVSPLVDLFRGCLAGEVSSPSQAFDLGAGLLFRLLWLPLGAIALFAFLPALLRGSGIRLRWSERFTNPLARLADERTLVNAGWAWVRVVVFALLALTVVWPLLPGLRLLPLQNGPGALVRAQISGLAGLVSRFVVAASLLAPLGLWLQRILQQRALRMGRQELADELRRDGAHPEIAAAIRSRGQAGGFEDGHIATVTHALTAPGEVLFLKLGFESGADNILLSRLPMSEAAPWLKQTAVATFWDAALHARLGALHSGDRIPPACYPVLARALSQSGIRKPAPQSP